ncbi:MAG: CoA-binding protein [Chloroflexota bacterium]|nr:CoA-binding protein [Chloroflexota bacterium]
MNTQARIADWVERRTWAVVGASDNRAKFGNRIYRVLRERGYTVYPVNPTLATVEGDPAYPDIAALPDGVEVLDIVIPPQRVPPVLDQAKAAGITRIWLQPGAESPAVIAHAAALGLDVIAGGPCAMVEARSWPGAITDTAMP